MAPMNENIPETADTGPGGRRPNRRGQWLLIGSLALNLLFAGALLGALLRAWMVPGAPRGNTLPVAALAQPALRDLGVGLYGRALSRDDQRLLLREALAQQNSLDHTRAQLRRQMAQLLRALRKTPYDGAQVRRLLKRQAAGLREWQALGTRLLAQRLEHMSDAQRAQFAARLERLLRKAARSE